MSTDLMLPERHPLPVPPQRPGTDTEARHPEPARPDTDTLEASTTYDPHDRVPLADAEAEC
jgi:hypothetical protein